MEYNKKIERVEDIISEINSGDVDPANIIKKIKEATTLLKECEEQLKGLKTNNNKE